MVLYLISFALRLIIPFLPVEEGATCVCDLSNEKCSAIEGAMPIEKVIQIIGCNPIKVNVIDGSNEVLFTWIDKDADMLWVKTHDGVVVSVSYTNVYAR